MPPWCALTDWSGTKGRVCTLSPDPAAAGLEASLQACSTVRHCWRSVTASAPLSSCLCKFARCRVCRYGWVYYLVPLAWNINAIVADQLGDKVRSIVLAQCIGAGSLPMHASQLTTCHVISSVIVQERGRKLSHAEADQPHREHRCRWRISCATTPLRACRTTNTSSGSILTATRPTTPSQSLSICRYAPANTVVALELACLSKLALIPSRWRQ